MLRLNCTVAYANGTERDVQWHASLRRRNLQGRRASRFLQGVVAPGALLYKRTSKLTPRHLCVFGCSLGHSDSTVGNRCLRVHTVRCPRVHKTVLCKPERSERSRRIGRKASDQWTTRRGRCPCWSRQRLCIWPRRTHSYSCVLFTFYLVVCHVRSVEASVTLQGLQTQSNTNPIYRGPWDAIKKISSAHGIAGIYKGQNVTFLREASGYGIYFWAYEKLVQREMSQKGIKREEISATSAVLYGAAAGYAVSRSSFHKKYGIDCMVWWCVHCVSAMGRYLPNRHDQVTDADGWLLACRRPKVQVCSRLFPHRSTDRGCRSVYERAGPHVDSVRTTRLHYPAITTTHRDFVFSFSTSVS